MFANFSKARLTPFIYASTCFKSLLTSAITHAYYIIGVLRARLTLRISTPWLESATCKLSGEA